MYLLDNWVQMVKRGGKIVATYALVEWYIQEEITSDIIGGKPSYKYIASDIREL